MLPNNIFCFFLHDVFDPNKDNWSFVQILKQLSVKFLSFEGVKMNRCRIAGTKYFKLTTIKTKSGDSFIDIQIIA